MVRGALFWWCMTYLPVAATLMPPMSTPSDPRSWAIAPIFAVISFLCVRTAWRHSRSALSSLSVFERGFAIRTPLGETVIADQDVVSLRYSVTRRFRMGIYQGTVVFLEVRDRMARHIVMYTLHSEEDAGWWASVGLPNDSAIDEIHDLCLRLSSVISDRMAEQLDTGSTLEIGRRVRADRAGVTPTAGRHKGVLIPWSKLSATVQEGTLRVSFFSSSQYKLVDFGVPADRENVWPFSFLIGSYPRLGSHRTQRGRLVPLSSGPTSP